MEDIFKKVIENASRALNEKLNDLSSSSAEYSACEASAILTNTVHQQPQQQLSDQRTLQQPQQPQQPQHQHQQSQYIVATASSEPHSCKPFSSCEQYLHPYVVNSKIVFIMHKKPLG